MDGVEFSVIVRKGKCAMLKREEFDKSTELTEGLQLLLWLASHCLRNKDSHLLWTVHLEKDLYAAE